MRIQWLGLLLVGAFVACSGSSGAKKASGVGSKAVAQALMRSVMLKGGSLKQGGLPPVSYPAVLLMPLAVDPIQPGDTTIMPLDFDNPDEADNPADRMLMQFVGASDHLESPVSASKSGSGDLNFELLVGDDVCTDLCNRKFDVKLQMELALEDGKIGALAEQTLSLDCTKKGDAERCGSTAAGTGGSKGSATKGSSGKGGSGGSGTHGGLDAGPERDAGAGIGFDANGLFPDGGFPFDAAAFLRDAGFGGDASGLYPDAASLGDGSINSFPCPSGSTVGLDKLCDGKNDCSDGYDEMVCVPCNDNNGKFSPFQRCDGKMACSDGSDELSCTFSCNNGEQVPTTAICDGKNDCSDGSDEAPCQFPCGDGTSVSSSKICDGKNDCANGADEAKSMCP
jgi:hypothetical protein